MARPILTSICIMNKEGALLSWITTLVPGETWIASFECGHQSLGKDGVCFECRNDSLVGKAQTSRYDIAGASSSFASSRHKIVKSCFPT